jgi:chromosome partitioning protein
MNMAAALATLGHRVLLVDLDPQAHATLGFGYQPNDLKQTVYDSLTNPLIPMSAVVMETKNERLDLVPSNILLGGAELELNNVLGKELVLGEQLRTVENNYHLCIIDSGPSLGLLMLNALVASTDVIVPVQVHFYALEGLKRLLETVRILKRRFHPCWVETLGLLLTFVDIRTTLSKQVQRGLRDFFGDLVFDTVIHRAVTLAEAPSAGESILTYAPNSRGAAEHMALAQETVARLRRSEGAEFRSVG